jgi:hypothetical protein
MSCKRRHGVTQRRLTTHRDYAGKVKAIIDFLDEDSRTVLESFVAGYEAKHKSSRTDFFRTRVW